jgi:hypothetical protein
MEYWFEIIFFIILFIFLGKKSKVPTWIWIFLSILFWTFDEISLILFGHEFSSIFFGKIGQILILLAILMSRLFFPKQEQKIHFHIKTNNIDIKSMNYDNDLKLINYPKYKYIYYRLLKFFIVINLIEIKPKHIKFWVSTYDYCMLNFVRITGDYRSRTLLVQLLGLVDSKESIYILRKSLNDKVITVVTQSILSLRRIGTNSQIESEIDKVYKYWLEEENKLRGSLQKAYKVKHEGKYFDRSQMTRFNYLKKVMKKFKGSMSIDQN